MQGKKIQENKLFYTVTLDRLVPQDHPVRRIAEVLDLGFLYEETKEYYSHEGKLSIDHVVLFKLYILGYFFGTSSDRRLFRKVQVNLAYRWHLGYDLDEEIPNLSSVKYYLSPHCLTLFVTLQGGVASCIMLPIKTVSEWKYGARN